MSTFELIGQLSKRDQKKILKILAINSSKRTSAEASYLAAILPYQNNEVIRYGEKTDLSDESGIDGNSVAEIPFNKALKWGVLIFNCSPDASKVISAPDKEETTSTRVLAGTVSSPSSIT